MGGVEEIHWVRCHADLYGELRGGRAVRWRGWATLGRNSARGRFPAYNESKITQTDEAPH